MGGENSHITFTKRSSIRSDTHPRSDNDFSNYRNPERAREAALRREAGVYEVAKELPNSPLAEEASRRPRSHRRGQRGEHTQLDHAGNPSPLSTQVDDEGLELLHQLDIEFRDNYSDPKYIRRRRGIISNHSKVWEPIGATPLVIDFSNIQEPISPHRLAPSARGSQHPQVPLYRWAKSQAHVHDPRKGVEGRQSRNEWYWEQMSRGNLPPDFNPYRPGSPAHNAFNERVSLLDDRPQAKGNPKFTGDAPVLMTPRQVRSRARRKATAGERLTDEEFLVLFKKPMEEWDAEELAEGRVKDKNGNFRGIRAGEYLSRELRERADSLFKDKVRKSMNTSTITALSVLEDILKNEDTDVKGKPVVAASTKLDAAKFMVEHLLGKPKATVETDIGAKLQGILAGVMVSPEMALPAPGSNDPVGPTGRMLAGQRGYRSDYVDEQMKALTAVGYIDAEVVEDDAEEDEGDAG